jgi:uncharacterized surface protein with fasciclin (FAS1) repeats
VTARLLHRCAVLGVLVVALGACGSEDPADDSAASTSSTSSSDAGATESSAAPAADQPFGPACSGVPTEGEGSFAGMVDDPVTTAASNNPGLSTLVQAVTAASLVASLDGQEDITVLAPSNAAFAAIPADALQALMADSARLTAVLTHHVIAGRLAPDQLAGTHITLNNDEVTVEGQGETFTIAGTATETDATVICGNVQTANATVYIIDQVLAPPA